MSKYFLIGIKGTGVCALASLLRDLGHNVSGSDNPNHYFTDDILSEKKIKCFNFNEAILDNSYIYIIGLAYDESNIDVKRVIDNNYEYYYYNDFIEKKLNLDIIAISGTHGKTTTTNFLSHMLNNTASYIIGDGSGKGIIGSEKLVLEACEYKNHFLSYFPKLLVINNIELDHPDFFKNVSDVINSFQMMANQSDLVIVNGDDENIKKLKIKNIITIGQEDNNDIIFKVLKENNYGTFINIKYRNNVYAILVPFWGIHFIYDFVMAYVVCLILGKKPYIDKIKLPNRRMKEYQYGKTILIDDYSHHPTEIKALYKSIKSKYPNYEIKAIFQPHTYSRTLALKKDFKEALSLFDCVYLEKVFPSQRENTDTFKQLKINKIFKNYRSFSPNVLNIIDKNKDEIWVFLGAGIIDKYISIILKNNENN